MGIFDSIYLANDPITSFIEVSALILLPGGPPSRPFRAAHLPVGIESSRSISCLTQMQGLDGETPSLPDAEGWTVRHHPYQMQGAGR
jgi:hypothetical protein